MFSGAAITSSPDSVHMDIHSSSHQRKAAQSKKRISLCLVLLVCFDPRPTKRSKGHCPRKVCLVSSFQIHFLHIKNCTWATETTQGAWVDGWPCRGMVAALLVVDLIHSRFLISRARHNVLIIYGDVAAQH